MGRLLEAHEWIDEHFLLHQEALTAGDLSLAFELLEKVEAGQREHMRVGEEVLLPVYERVGRVREGTPSSSRTSTGRCSRSSTASRRPCPG